MKLCIQESDCYDLIKKTPARQRYCRGQDCGGYFGVYFNKTPIISAYHSGVHSVPLRLNTLIILRKDKPQCSAALYLMHHRLFQQTLRYHFNASRMLDNSALIFEFFQNPADYFTGCAEFVGNLPVREFQNVIAF